LTGGTHDLAHAAREAALDAELTEHEADMAGARAGAGASAWIDQRQIERQQRQIDDLTGGTQDLAHAAREAALDAELTEHEADVAGAGAGAGARPTAEVPTRQIDDLTSYGDTQDLAHAARNAALDARSERAWRLRRRTAATELAKRANEEQTDEEGFAENILV
jgi:hypothetical protein